MDEKRPSADALASDIVENETGYLIQDDPKEDKDFDTGFEPDEQIIRPVVGGLRIRGSQSVDFERRPSFGTLGCFAITTGKDAGQRVLLTNFHVLEDPFHKLNGPSCTGCTKGDAVGNPNVGDQIATVLRGEDNPRMDAAIAIMNKGVEFDRDIFNDAALPPREFISGTRNLTAADKGLVVHKLGHRTRLTTGVIGKVGGPVTIAGKRKENQIEIDLVEKISGANVTFPADGKISAPAVDFVAEGVRVNDVAWIDSTTNRGRFRITAVGPPLSVHELVVAGALKAAVGNFGGALFVTGPNFALSGDSGSVLLDPQGKVVGLIWAARALRVGNAIATPIDVVEKELRIKIDAATATGDTQTARVGGGGTRAVIVEEAEPGRPAAAAFGAEEPVTLRTRVEQDLLPLPRGRQIYDLYFRHHMEVRKLLDANRPVALVWHRQGGPGIIQGVLDAVRSRESAVPAAIRGKSWSDRIAAILAVFAEHGSAPLRDDIAEFGHDVAGLGGMTYPRFLESLKA
jgi:hypothetical protein